MAFDPPFQRPEVTALVELAFAEDLDGAGDVTSRAMVDPDANCRARLVAREAGVAAGLDLARYVFSKRTPDLAWEASVSDGARVPAASVLASLSGNARGVLEAERVALNFLGRLSGIATRARALADAARPLGIAVYDTRKTTPGWRALEKYAVRCGGACNHRMGLYDAVLVKDNHRVLAGLSLAEALRTASWPPDLALMVEAESESDVDAAVAAGASVVLLDNQDPAGLARLAARVREACARTGRSRPLLEASGGITESSLAAVAAAGVDRVSVGALTHSARSLDVALDLFV